MKIPFIKMQGAGNDYVYIDCFETPFETLPEISALAKKMSDRHFGIGSDGLVLIMPSDNGSELRMRMFNSDGSEAQMCGNASRCVAKYAFDTQKVKTKEFTLQTKAGQKQIQIIDSDTVTVNMGKPEIITEENFLEISGVTYRYTDVSMGNPHCVIFVEDVKNFPVETVGRQIEIHKNFPEKTNVEFIKVIDNKTLEMRVWERGAGETLACGTGACASGVASFINGRSERNVRLRLLGGDLQINWSEKDGCVYMTGGAKIVFKGEFYY